MPIPYNYPHNLIRKLHALRGSISVLERLNRSYAPIFWNDPAVIRNLENLWRDYCTVREAIKSDPVLMKDLGANLDAFETAPSPDEESYVLLFNAVKAINVAKALELANRASTDKERAFFLFVADMTREELQKEIYRTTPY